MLANEGQKLLYWNYFLTLEADLEVLSRYVEFSKDNYATYSTEMVRILLAAGSEVDVVLKELCRKLEPTSRAENIEEYRRCVLRLQPEISSARVRLPRHATAIVPWENWRVDQTPDWWRSYNNVKHQRGENYREANLQQVIASVAGLFILLLFLYRKEAEDGDLAPISRLFLPPVDFVGGFTAGTFDITLVYHLPPPHA